MFTLTKALTLSVLAVLIAFIFASHIAEASPGGTEGASGAYGVTCNDCHHGGSLPVVDVTGSAVVQPSQTVAYLLTITSTAPLSQTHAGWNIALLDGFQPAGTLAPIQGDSSSKLISAELVHTEPITNVNGVTTVAFNWTAPTTPGTYTLFFAGNSVDNNRMSAQASSGTSGDLAGIGSLTITVSAPTSVAFTQPATQTDSMLYIHTSALLLSLLTYLIRFRRVRK